MSWCFELLPSTICLFQLPVLHTIPIRPSGRDRLMSTDNLLRDVPHSPNCICHASLTRQSGRMRVALNGRDGWQPSQSKAYIRVSALGYRGPKVPNVKQRLYSVLEAARSSHVRKIDRISHCLAEILKLSSGEYRNLARICPAVVYPRQDRSRRLIAALAYASRDHIAAVALRGLSESNSSSRRE